MKKSELKTGMVVTLRNGERGMVFKDIFTAYTKKMPSYQEGVIVGFKDGNFSWDSLSFYREDMLSNDEQYNYMDIMKVEVVDHPYDFLKGFDAKKIVETIFEREPSENFKFQKWLETEYAKHFTTSKSKQKSINELVYTLRMSGTGRDFCLNILDDSGGCVCVPSVNESFVPTRHLEKKIVSIEYDTEEPDYPIVIIKV